MNCIACKDRLVAYVEGLLCETDRQAMKSHLQECPSCRAEAEHLASTHARLLRDGQADPPASLTDAVMDRILWSEKPKRGNAMWRTTMTHKYAVLGVAAACVVAVTITLVLANRPPDKSSDAQAQRAANHPVVPPAPQANGGSVALARRPGDSPLSSKLLTHRSLKDMVADAKVIVVATVLHSTPVPPKQPGDAAEVAIRWKVARILKGDLRTEEIITQTPGAGVGAGVGELANKEWILLLSPEFLAGKYPYAGILNVKEEPNVRSIVSGAGAAP